MKWIFGWLAGWLAGWMDDERCWSVHERSTHETNNETEAGMGW